MNNRTSKRNNGLETDKLRSQLLQKMESMTEILEREMIPSIDECTKLQIMLREHLEFSKNSYPIHHYNDNKIEGEGNFKITFSDVSGEEVKSNDIIKDILSIPEAMSLLFTVGLQKLAYKESLMISDTILEQLINKGYIANIGFDNGKKRKELISLTSKGWVCFSRKIIAKQIRKERGYAFPMLPDWLSVPQTKWKPGTYERALLLKDYYDNVVKSEEYMIFSFPENIQLLFGCKSDSQDIEYTIAITEAVPINDEELRTVLKVVSSDAINQLLLISSSEIYGQEVLKHIQNEVAGIEKIQLVNMEA